MALFTSLVLGLAAPAFAQTLPGAATLTRWDIFAASGGVNSSSSTATQNVVAITRNPADGGVWFVSQRPSLRLGRLDPSASINNYLEWPLSGSGGSPTGVVLNAMTGDVWVSTGATPHVVVKVGGTNTFRAYQLPLTGAVAHGFGVTPDGSIAYVPVKAGNNTGIYKLVRVSSGTATVATERWRFPSSGDDPRHLTIDASGKLWFVNRYRNTLARLDPSLTSGNLTQWTLPTSQTLKSAAGIHIVNGSSGAATVCVVMENAVDQPAGEAQCLDVSTNTFSLFIRPEGSGLSYPQQVAGNSAGELLVTERYGNAVSMIGATAITAAAQQVVTPASGNLNKGTTLTTTITETSASPVTRTAMATVVSLAGVENPAGHVRFALPALAALPDQPGVVRDSRPVGISAVFGDTGPGTGSVFIAESFDGPSPITSNMGAAISAVTLGGAGVPDVFSVLPAALSFEGDVDGAAPPAQQISIEEQSGRTIDWAVTAAQSWLTLSVNAGSTPASVTVTVSQAGLSTGTVQDTITVDDGPGGAEPVQIPVTLTVVERPTMVVTPALLTFTAVNTDTTPPPAKTFAISSEGGAPLEWTATVNIPGVEAELEVPGQPLSPTLSGTGPAAVTLHIRSIPGTLGLRQGTVVISSPNASNPSATVNIEYDVTDVPQPLLVNRDTVTFTAPRGGAAPQPQTITLTNAGGTPLTWGTIFPYTAEAQPDWITISPTFSALDAGASVEITISVNPSALSSAGSLAGTITIDDHTGNSPPAIVGVVLALTAPTIDFSPNTVTFTADEGAAAASQTVTLTNTGDAPLTFTPQVTVNNGSGWLTVSPTGEATLEPGASSLFTVTSGDASLAAGTYTAQITVADPYSTNGSDTVSITLTVNTVSDTTAPVLTLPGDIAVEATGPAGAAVTFSASATDAGGPIAVTCAPASGSTFAVGTTAVNCSATDAAGNVASGSFAVTVTAVATDTTAPVVTAPASQVREATSAAGATATFAATATDAGSTPVIAYSHAPGSTFPLGSTTVTVTATDASGNSASATFTITVVDTQAPSLVVPGDMTVAGTDALGAVVSFSASASDLVSGATTVTCTPASGSTFPVGTTTVSCSTADGAGNVASGSFTVTVTAVATDTTAPVVTAPASQVREATSAAGATATFAATATDAGSTPVITYSHAPGSTFPLGSTTVTVTATDASGNSASATFTITVVDTQAPSLVVPGDMTVAGTDALGAVVSFSASASDLVSGATAVTCTPASGSMFPVGTTTVSCSTADGAGNTASGTFAVTVTAPDTTAPVITVPADIVVEATSAAGATVTFAATASDDGSTPVLSYSLASGNTFPIGTTPVTVTATDAMGNAASATFAVTVQDTTAPSVAAPANQTLEATGATGAMASFAATATDLVSTPVITYSTNPGTMFPLGTTTVTVTAADAAGNTATASFTVLVRDTTPPVLTVPASMTVPATSAAGATVTYSATAADSVSGATAVTCTPPSGTTFAVATTTVTCSTNDAAGNVASQSFSVTVTPLPASLSLGSSSLYFKTGRLAYCNGLPVGPNWKDQGLVITNSGGASLNYAVSTATSWIRVTPASGSLSAGASTTLVVSVDLTALGRGIYQGSLTVSANGISQAVPVTLEIGNALPTLCLTPKYMTWGSVKGGTTTTLKSFDVMNVGDDPMANWTSTKTITQGTLTMSATGGVAPKSVNVSVKAGKAKGAQSAKITISAPGAVQGTQAIDLAWTVQ